MVENPQIGDVVWTASGGPHAWKVEDGRTLCMGAQGTIAVRDQVDGYGCFRHCEELFDNEREAWSVYVAWLQAESAKIEATLRDLRANIAEGRKRLMAIDLKTAKA